MVLAFYKLTRTAAPPNRAAAPTAPVIIGAAFLVDEVAPVAAGAVDVGTGMPEVKGTPPPLALEAPVKAGSWELAEGLGLAVLFWGFRTLRVIHC